MTDVTAKSCHLLKPTAEMVLCCAISMTEVTGCKDLGWAGYAVLHWLSWAEQALVEFGWVAADTVGLCMHLQEDKDGKYWLEPISQMWPASICQTAASHTHTHTGLALLHHCQRQATRWLL